MADKATVTFLEGKTIGVAEIAALYERLTGRIMTEDEQGYAAKALASGRRADGSSPKEASDGAEHREPCA